MKEVFFVRHAQSESNVDGIQRGDASLLSEQGVAQAKEVAKRIKAIGVEALIASPYPRAHATAEAIALETGLAIEASELFVERKAPSVTLGKSFKDPEARSILTSLFEGYKDETHRHSDEENFDDLKARAGSALKFLEDHDSNRICVVSHGLFLRILFCSAVFGENFSGATLQASLQGLETENTGIFYFRFSTSRWETEEKKTWKIVSWNDLAHLGEA